MNPNQGPSDPEYPAPNGQGFNVQDLTQRWRTVLTGRSVPTFDAQLPSANWRSIWVALIILGVTRGAVGALQSAITPTVRIGNTLHSNGSPVARLVSGFVVAILEFFIEVGILHVIAKSFKGTGSFLGYAYLLSLVYAPLSIASALIGWIPQVGGLALLALGIFEIYMAILATASAHRLSMKDATWVVLTLVVAAIALFVFLSFLFVLDAALLM